MKVVELSQFCKEGFPLMDGILLQTIAALSLHEQLHETIEKDYAENKKAAFRVYQKSSLYRPHLFESHPVPNKVRMQKLLALYLYYEKLEEGKGREKLIDYIIQGYKRIYDYVQQQNTLSSSSFLAYYISHRETIPEPLQTTLIGLALFIAHPDKEVVPMNEDPILRSFLYNTQTNYKSFANLDTTFMKKRKEQELSSLRKYQEVVGTKFGKNDLLDTVLTNMEAEAVKELTKTEKRELIQRGNYTKLYSKNLYRFWKPLTALLRLNNLDELNFGLIPMTREDLLDIHAVFTDSVERGRLKDEDYAFFISASFALLMLTKHYHELSNEFLSLFEQDSEIEQIKKEEEWEEERQRLSEKEKELEKSLSLEQEKNQLQEKRIEELERQLKQSEQQVIEDEQLRKEVIALRDYVFREETTEEEPILEEDTLLDDISFLSDKKVVIVGGHQLLHNKLKEELPNIRTIHPNEKNIDFSFIRQMDIVCIETSYNNHTIYKKAMSHLNKERNTLIYSNKATNVKSLIRNIRKAYKEN